jgi:cation diffusion facilitator family transporter
MRSETHERPIVVYAAALANLAIAVTKFAVATVTGSSAMISEGIHSSVDTGNELLLLLGIHRGKRPPDERHPFGHGKEVFFWGLIVAIVLFGLGGGMSIYEGFTHLRRPRELGGSVWTYVVLGASFLFEATSFSVALRAFRRSKPRRIGWWDALRASKNPSVYTVLVEDSAAMTGLVIAFLGVTLGRALRLPWIDGVASLAIGVLLAGTALFLARESLGLLVGESAGQAVVARIREAVVHDEAVRCVREVLTMHLAPDRILVNVSVEFRNGLSGDDVLRAIARIDGAIREAIPMVTRVFVDTEGPREVEAAAPQMA